MDDNLKFKSVGKNVKIEENVYIAHPEVMEIGDNVTFMRGFYMMGRPETCRIGSNVTFYPNCFIQGLPARLIVEEHVTFYPNTYISMGNGNEAFVEIGHNSHFAPGCVLYGQGGLKIGAYNNIAAHTVFATVGHDHSAADIPMTLAGRKTGPITLEDDIWIAANVTVCANTVIAGGCVIGANAVVTKNTEPMGIYFGVPAKRVRDRQ